MNIPVGDLAHLTLIRRNRRFAAFRGETNLGQELFIKTAVSRTLAKAIYREALGLKQMKELDPGASLFDVPKVIGLSEDTIVTNWVKGLTLIDKFGGDVNALLDAFGPRLVGIFAYIEGRTTPARHYNVNNKGYKAILGDRSAYLRLRNNGRAGPSVLDHILEFLRENLDTIETGFCHPDLNFGNIMTSGAKLTIIDCETCSWLWPRHYSIANTIFNYSVRYPESASKLAKLMMDYLELLELKPNDPVTVQHINFSAGLRCVWRVCEFLADNPDKTEQEAVPDAFWLLAEKTYKNILQGRIFTDT